MSYQNNVIGLSQLLMAGGLLGVHWEGSSSMGKPRILQVPVSVGQKRTAGDALWITLSERTTQ